MANLDRLMRLGGAVCTYEFSPTGEVVACHGNLPSETCGFLSKLCAANSLMGDTEVDTLTRITGMKWQPYYGWAISAGDYSLCVIGHIGVCIETKHADFNEVFRILGEEAHVTLRAAA